MKKIVLSAEINCEKCRREAYEAISNVDGVESVTIDIKEKKVTVIGDADPTSLTMKLRRVGWVELVSVGPHVQENKKVMMMEDKKDSKEIKNSSKQEDKNPSPKEDKKDTKNGKNGSKQEEKKPSPNKDKKDSKEGKNSSKKEDNKSHPKEDIKDSKDSKDGKNSSKKEDKKSSPKEDNKDSKDGKNVSQKEDKNYSKEGKNVSKKEDKMDVTSKVQTQHFECTNMGQAQDMNICMRGIPEEQINYTHTLVIGGSCNCNHCEDIYILSDENPNACSIC